MVDQDLRSAANEIAGEFEELDPLSIAVTATGLGIGMFTGEFVAEIIGNMVAPQTGRTRTAVEIASKLGMSGVFLVLRRFVGQSALGVITILAAAGSAGVAALQTMESVVGLLQTGEITSSAPQSGAITEGYSAGGPSSGSATGGQLDGQSFAAT